MPRATAVWIFASAHLNKFYGIKKVKKSLSIKAEINFSMKTHPQVWEKSLNYFIFPLFPGSFRLPHFPRPLFLRRALQIQRQQPLQNLFIGQIAGPARGRR